MVLRRPELRLLLCAPAAIPDDDLPREPWYLVAPVTLASPAAPAAPPPHKRAARTPPRDAPPHAARPRAHAVVDWAALCRLAAGPVPVQDAVPLGPFAVPGAAPLNGDAAAPSASAGALPPHATAPPPQEPLPQQQQPMDVNQQQEQQQRRQVMASPEEAAAVSARLDEALRGRVLVPAYRTDARLVYLGPAMSRTVRATQLPAAGAAGPAAGGERPASTLAAQNGSKGDGGGGVVGAEALVEGTAAMRIEEGGGAGARVGGAGGVAAAAVSPEQQEQERERAEAEVEVVVEELTPRRLLTLGDVVLGGAPARAQLQLQKQQQQQQQQQEVRQEEQREEQRAEAPEGGAAPGGKKGKGKGKGGRRAGSSTYQAMWTK